MGFDKVIAMIDAATLDLVGIQSMAGANRLEKT